ncbi:hypothetical protein AB1Y20_016268 [Prymnesium parvum]|uniref:Kinesin motor domain-containing protein n=1 Tax=Prymnesium parvum TaxID=97485 RepID=A0AB34IC75_PRYPA
MASAEPLDTAPDTVADPRRKLSFSDFPDEQPTVAQCEAGRLQVYVRLRALSKDQESADIYAAERSISLRTTKTNTAGKDTVEETSFTFDGVFDGTSTQAEVFESAMLPQVEGLFHGKDTLTFAYGITNAGKTYTIQGKDGADELGVLPRALAVMFAAIERNAEVAAGRTPPDAPPHVAAAMSEMVLNPTYTYEVRASFLEVYGNDAYDLLVPAEKGTKRQTLKLKEDKSQVFVEGLKEVELPDISSALTAVQLGWQQRSAASNGLNDLSSRSHAVLCVKLLTHRPGHSKPMATRMCVVDLAGAERQKKTHSNGARLNEANSINKDLMILGHCLRDLRWNQAHPRSTQRMPPFRDSRITMLFRDYLSGGRGTCIVIAAVSPRLADQVGTLDTLRFAAVAQQVKLVEIKPHHKVAHPVGVPKLGDRGASRGISALSSRLDERGSITSDEVSNSAPSITTYVAEIHTLREQIAFLQEKVLQGECDNLAAERRIREEVAAEMKEYLETSEAEAAARIEEDRYATEEMYHKKLALVKDVTEKRAESASVQAHTELLQQTREWQRLEAEHSAQVRRLEAELEQYRSRGAAKEVDTVEQAVAESTERAKVAESLLAKMSAELEKERKARAAVEERVASLEGALESERQKAKSAKKAAHAAEAELAKLKAQSENALEQGQEPSQNSRAPLVSVSEEAPLDAASAPSPKRPFVEIPLHNVMDGGSPSKKVRRPSRATRGSLPNSVQQPSQQPVLDVEVSKNKTSKLKMLRSTMWPASKKKEADNFVDLTRSDSGFDQSVRSSASDVPNHVVEPTPLARRTRAGRAAAHLR